MKTTARAECKGAEIGWRDFCGAGVAGLARGASALVRGPSRCAARSGRVGGIGALTLNPLGDGEFAGSALDGHIWLPSSGLKLDTLEQYNTRTRNGPTHPVLKHGPRSATRVRVFGR